MATTVNTTTAPTTISPGVTQDPNLTAFDPNVIAATKWWTEMFKSSPREQVNASSIDCGDFLGDIHDVLW